jgi:hypothetical protein
MVNLMLKLFKKGDFYVFSFLVIIFILCSYFYLKLPKGDFLEITEGNTTKKFSLAQKKIIEFKNNKIEINMGRVRMRKSNCPNKYCIMQGWIERHNHSIICIPNFFKITIKSNNSNFDTTSY